MMRKKFFSDFSEPNFVGSFALDDYVYFFLRENAVEFSNSYTTTATYSRVARVCKKDRGSVDSRRNPRPFWSTFFKARLNCSAPGDQPFQFDEIQSISGLNQGNYNGNPANVVYGVFTTAVNSIPGSAVCIFNMADVGRSFSGRFKEQRTLAQNWLPVSPADVPEPRPGLCVNDSTTLPEQVLTFAKEHPIMNDPVPPMYGRPVLIFTGLETRYTTIAVAPQVKTVDDRVRSQFLFDRSIDWFVQRLIDWLICSVFDWLICSAFDWLIDLFSVRLIDWLSDGLIAAFVSSYVFSCIFSAFYSTTTCCTWERQTDTLSSPSTWTLTINRPMSRWWLRRLTSSREPANQWLVSKSWEIKSLRCSTMRSTRCRWNGAVCGRVAWNASRCAIPIVPGWTTNANFKIPPAGKTFFSTKHFFSNFFNLLIKFSIVNLFELEIFFRIFFKNFFKNFFQKFFQKFFSF